MYKAIRYFEDLQDENHPYNPGDTFPRKGFKASKERLAELASNQNKQGTPVIQEVKASKK